MLDDAYRDIPREKLVDRISELEGLLEEKEEPEPVVDLSVPPSKWYMSFRLWAPALLACSTCIGYAAYLHLDKAVSLYIFIVIVVAVFGVIFGLICMDKESSRQLGARVILGAVLGAPAWPLLLAIGLTAVLTWLCFKAFSKDYI